jgi:hypothetical protein
MTEIVIYRADDGTDFEDEWDCKHYEWQQSCESAEYTLLGRHLFILPTEDTSSYEDACFIFIPTQASAFALCNNWDTDMINADCPSFLPWRADQTIELGLWAWDEDLEKWYHLGKKVDELTQLATKAMDAINGA